MSEVLDDLPQAAQLVHDDLVHPKTKRLGRKGMAVEQVLRAMFIKQMKGFSYEELAFHLADSNVYRWFCRLGIGDTSPKKSTLQKSIKRARAETCGGASPRLTLRNGATLPDGAGRATRRLQKPRRRPARHLEELILVVRLPSATTTDNTRAPVTKLTR